MRKLGQILDDIWWSSCTCDIMNRFICDIHPLKKELEEKLLALIPEKALENE